MCHVAGNADTQDCVYARMYSVAHLADWCVILLLCYLL